jgi:hypothetical protein
VPLACWVGAGPYDLASHHLSHSRSAGQPLGLTSKMAAFSQSTSTGVYENQCFGVPDLTLDVIDR